MTYKVHIDGYNNLAYWEGKLDKSARGHYFYFYESSLSMIRVGHGKCGFHPNLAENTTMIW